MCRGKSEQLSTAKAQSYRQETEVGWAMGRDQTAQSPAFLLRSGGFWMMATGKSGKGPKLGSHMVRVWY